MVVSGLGVFLGVAIVGALAWHVARRRDVGDVPLPLLRLSERLRGRSLHRRVTRVADAVAAHEPLPCKPPETVDRAAVRRAEQQRRIAERRERLLEEQARLREEAQQRAAEEWEARVNDTRERAAALARSNAEAIERARRLRFERAEALADARRDAEERRLQQVRDAEERRRQDATERAQRRLRELADRRRLGREAEAAMKDAFVADDLHRQHETELSRAEVVQLRSEEAREIARSWVVHPRDTNRDDAPPPIPGEHRAVETLMVELPAPGATPPPVAAVAAPPTATSPQPTTLPRSQSAPAVAPVRASAARRVAPRTDEKVAVRALDVDALNALLQRD